MLTTQVKGKSTEEALTLAAKFIKMMRGEEGGYADMGELQALQGVSKYALRVKCATLAWHAMEQAIQKEHKGGPTRWLRHLKRSVPGQTQLTS